MEFIYNLIYTIGWVPAFIIGLYNFIRPKLKQDEVIILFITLSFGTLVGVKYSMAFMFIAFIIIFLYLYYMRKSIMTLLMLPLTYIMNVIVDNILELLFYFTFHINHEELMHTPVLILLFICETFIDYLTTRFSSRMLHRHLFNNMVTISKKLTAALFLNLLICCAIILVNVFAGAKLGYQATDVVFTIVLCVVFFLLSSALLAYSIRSAQEAAVARERLQHYEHLKEYTANLEQTYENLRSFKHDYVNIIASISSYLEEGQYGRLSEYFYGHIAPTRQRLEQNTESLNKLMHVRQLEVKSLLSFKLMYALEQGIAVDVDIPGDVHASPMDPIDLTRILGIFLDNAIEAAREASEPKIGLYIADCGGHTAMFLSNTFQDHGLSIPDMVRPHASTKGEGRGIGLSNVRKILARHPEVFHETCIHGELFIQHLELPN